jgi:hypothetical protein
MTTTINGRTPEEIKKGLECCTGSPVCSECPYFHDVDCNSVERDAFAYIQQLERERDEARNDLDTINYANTELHSAYEAMKRERDAAVEAVGKLAYNADRSIACEFCEFRDYQCFVCEFKWRGVEEKE